MQFVETNKDFLTSVKRALNEIDPYYPSLDGLLIGGTHMPEKIEEKIEKIRIARETGIPFLGICMGMQLMVIEYFRNVLNVPKATSEEFDILGVPVITKLGYERNGLHKVSWKGKITQESHWHNYAVRGSVINQLKNNGFYTSLTEDILEVAKLVKDNFFMGVQFHPEYQSSKLLPHPILKDFITACRLYTAADGRLPSVS